MFVSVEVITILGTTATILVAMASGFGWVITRMDARFEAVDARFVAVDSRFEAVDARFEAVDSRFVSLESRLDARFAAVDSRFVSMESRMEARFVALEEKMDVRFAGVERDLNDVKAEVTEVKIAVARLEGPLPRLMRVR